MKPIKNPYIQKLFQEKRILVSYVRNEIGFKRGAVVAFKREDGSHLVGASVVHPDDYVALCSTLNGLPVFQHITNQHPEMSYFFNKVTGVFFIPNFNREKAILQAIQNARDLEWTSFDPELNDAYEKMRERACLYFGPKGNYDYDCR